MLSLMSHDPEDASARAKTPPSPGGTESIEIQRRFAELLESDPQAVLDATRDSGGHVVLNADDLFKRWPEYEANSLARRWLGPLLYPVARKFTDHLYAELLHSAPTTGNTVIFTAGGGASGKSTVLRAQANRPEVDFVVDTTFSDSPRAIAQIEAALGASREVEINYVHRNFEEAVHGMIERALDPKVGRIVPIDDLAKTHFGAQRTIFAILERYEEEPRVAIRLWKSLPDNKVRTLTLVGLFKRRLPDIDALQKQGQTVLDETFAEANQNPTGQWGGLCGQRTFYEAARSKAQGSVANSSTFDH
jgi:hypothetical protein